MSIQVQMTTKYNNIPSAPQEDEPGCDSNLTQYEESVEGEQVSSTTLENDQGEDMQTTALENDQGEDMQTTALASAPNEPEIRIWQNDLFHFEQREYIKLNISGYSTFIDVNVDDGCYEYINIINNKPVRRFEIRDKQVVGVMEFFDRNGKLSILSKPIPNGVYGIKYHKGQIIIKGVMRDGKFTGPGQLFEDDILVYQGMLQNGSPHGQGVSFQNGGFRGEFKDGRPYTGHGTFRTSYRETFVGNLENGHKIHGKLYMHDTIVFDGTFLDDKPYNGYGRVDVSRVDADISRVFEGEIKNGLITHGSLYHKARFPNISNTATYTGDFLDDGKQLLYHGNGVLYHDNYVITALFEYGQAVSGTCKNSNTNSEFKGTFRNNEPFKGELYKYNILTFTGVFDKPTYVLSIFLRYSYGEEFYPNGQVKFKGSFSKGEYHRGVLYHENGQPYFDGTFGDQKLTGYDLQPLIARVAPMEASMGKVYDKQGTLIYEGPLKFGKYHGEGVIYENGKPKHGKWNFGKREVSSCMIM